MSQPIEFTASAYHSYDGQIDGSPSATRVQPEDIPEDEGTSRLACDQPDNEAKDRLDRVREATRQTRLFANMQQPTLPINSFRPNTRGHRVSFLNKLRDHYESRNKQQKIIQPLCTYSGARNLPSRLFQEADAQQQRLLLEKLDADAKESEADTSYSQITPAPKDGSDGCMNMIPKTWTRADVEAGLDHYQFKSGSYTAAPSGGYRNTYSGSSEPVQRITYYSDTDGDMGVAPGDSRR